MFTPLRLKSKEELCIAFKTEYRQLYQYVNRYRELTKTTNVHLFYNTFYHFLEPSHCLLNCPSCEAKRTTTEQSDCSRMHACMSVQTCVVPNTGCKRQYGSKCDTRAQYKTSVCKKKHSHANAFCIKAIVSACSLTSVYWKLIIQLQP